MSTWFRKEDIWIPVIMIVVLLFAFLFWCVGNDTESRSEACRMKGGTLVYIKHRGHMCLQEVK